MPEPDSIHDPSKADSYTRSKRILRLTGFALNLGYLLLLVFAGWSQSLRDGALGLTENSFLAIALYLLAFLCILQLLTLPLNAYSGFVVEHRFGLSNQTIGSWLKDWLKGFALSFAFGLAGAEFVYYTLRQYPEIWWLLCSVAFVAFFVLMAQLAPVLLFPLFFKFEPLNNEELEQRLLKLSEKAGARVKSVLLWKLSEKSKKANAALTGWGRTRRIILSDTLLENHSHDEIEVILAHELGHHVHGDIRSGILIQSGLTFAGFYLVHLALGAWSGPLGFTGPADFANLPLLLLVTTAASLVVMPWSNAFSRWRERAADRFALRTTGLRTAFISAMEKLAAQNLAQRRPHPLIEFIFHSHPSVEKRVSFAKSWKA